MIEKEAATLPQNQAKVICYASALNKQLCNYGHTYLIEFVHVCGYYSRAATIWDAASI